MEALQMLKREAEKENKRRAQAIKLLEQITEEIAEPLAELLGEDEYNDVFKGFIWVHRGLYFRYVEHREEKDVEKVGFYLTDDLPIWGRPLEDVKGRLFWQYIIEICEWIENLPAFIQELDKGRESFSYLKKIAEAIDEAKNRSE